MTAGILPFLVDALNVLLEALFKAGHVESALDEYRRMKNKGCILCCRL